MNYTLIALIFLISFIATLFLTPVVAFFAKKLDVIQYPPSVLLKKMAEKKSVKSYKVIAARRRQSKPPTPLWGGISYVVVFIFISLYVLLKSKVINLGMENLGMYFLWFAGIVVLFIEGILDDKYEFPGKIQFIAHLTAAILFAISNADLKYINVPFLSEPLNVAIRQFSANVGFLNLSFVFPGDILLIIWIIAMLWALKLQAGSDALMEGTVIIAVLFIGAVSIHFRQYASALFSFVLAGAVLGFTVYNFYPALIFSGSSGKTVMGYLIATLSVISGAKLGVAAIVFSIPLIDFFYVVIKRIFYYKPKSISQLFSISDRFHLHYRLMKIGLSEVQVAILEYTITLILGLGAFLLDTKYKEIFFIISWILIFIGIILINKKADEKAIYEAVKNAEERQ